MFQLTTIAYLKSERKIKTFKVLENVRNKFE